MEELLDFDRILREFLQDRISRYAGSRQGGWQIVTDKENAVYLLMRYGWQEGLYVYTIYYHFDIRNGKIWLQANNTEDDQIGAFLMERGVRADQIVLGFVAPEMRRATKYASE